MSQVNILFYSNKCEASKHLISLMQSENLLRFFHLICTDNNPRLPPQIKITPTIIIKNVPTPFEANMAFDWLARIKQWKTNMMLQKISSAQQQYLKNINNNLVSSDNNLLGFSKMEMQGMSDIFAYLEESITPDKAQDEIYVPHTYFNYQQLGTESILTPPLENGDFKVTPDSKCKLNPSKSKELQTSLMIERKKQDELFKQNIENFKKQYSQK